MDVISDATLGSIYNNNTYLKISKQNIDAKKRFTLLLFFYINRQKEKNNMLLRIFKGNYLFNYILFPLVSVLLISGTLLSSSGQSIAVPITSSPLGVLLSGITIHTTGSVLINLLVVWLISLLLFHINARFSMVKDVSFLPSYLFLFIVFAIPDFRYLQPILPSALFIALSFRSIFLSLEKDNMTPNIFDASFFVGVASLFYFFASVLILAIPLGILVMHKKINWKNLSATLLGLILPWGLLYIILFLSDHTLELNKLTWQFVTHENSLMAKNIALYLYLGFILILTLISSFFILKQYDEKNINTRRYFKVLFIFFVASLVLLPIPAVAGEIIVLATLPLTFLITNYLTYMKRRTWAELFFTVLIIFSIILQFVY